MRVLCDDGRRGEAVVRRLLFCCGHLLRTRFLPLAAAWWRAAVRIHLQVPDLTIASISGGALTFRAHVPIESPVLGEAAVALRAFERLFAGVVADVSHQGAFLAEAPRAVLTDVRLLVAVGPLMHLQGILRKRGEGGFRLLRRGVQKNGHLLTHLGLVALAAPGTVVGPLVRVRPHVLANVPDGFVQLAALAALVPPLADVDLHVLLQQVTGQKLLLAQGALEGLVTCARRGRNGKLSVTEG